MKIVSFQQSFYTDEVFAHRQKEYCDIIFGPLNTSRSLKRLHTVRYFPEMESVDGEHDGERKELRLAEERPEK